MSRPIEDRLVAGDPNPLHVEPDDEVLDALVRRATITARVVAIAVGLAIALLLLAAIRG